MATHSDTASKCSVAFLFLGRFWNASDSYGKMLYVFLLILGAGCGPKGPGQPILGPDSSRKAAPAVNVLVAPRIQQAPAPAAALPPPERRLTPADLAYLRWLIQFDSAVQRTVAQQAQDLPRAMQGRGESRLDAMLKSWQDSRQAMAALNTNAVMSDQFSGRLQEVQAQFQSNPPPPACRGIATGYSRVLAALLAEERFNGRLYRQFGLLLQNPRAGSAMLPSDLQDGGTAVDTQLRGDRQSARDSTNASLSEIRQRFPDDLPSDIAAFQIR